MLRIGVIGDRQCRSKFPKTGNCRTTLVPLDGRARTAWRPMRCSKLLMAPRMRFHTAWVESSHMPQNATAAKSRSTRRLGDLDSSYSLISFCRCAQLKPARAFRSTSMHGQPIIARRSARSRALDARFLAACDTSESGEYGFAAGASILASTPTRNAHDLFPAGRSAD